MKPLGVLESYHKFYFARFRSGGIWAFPFSTMSFRIDIQSRWASSKPTGFNTLEANR